MTYEDIIDDAYGLSLKTQPGQTATEHPELTGVVFRTLEAVYCIAASVNPTFFGKTTTIAAPGAGSPYPEPSDAESIFYMENDTDDGEVVTVRLEEKDEEEGVGRVYSLGRNLHSVGAAQDPDPANDGLNVWYSARPTTEPAAVTDNLPADWATQFNNLLIYQVGIYIATKDIGSQAEEAGLLQQERNKELARFIRSLENRLANVRTRFQSRIVTDTQSIVSHRELLSGALGVEG